MTKVYIVTDGEYSDYHVEAVFTNKKLAKAWIELRKTDEYSSPRIEEWDTNQAEEMLREGTHLFSVNVEKGGRAWASNWDAYIGSTEVNKISWWGKKGDVPTMSIHVIAKDEQHAIKIGNEKRAQLLALEQWPATRP